MGPSPPPPTHTPAGLLSREGGCLALTAAAPEHAPPSLLHPATWITKTWFTKPASWFTKPWFAKPASWFTKTWLKKPVSWFTKPWFTKP